MLLLLYYTLEEGALGAPPVILTWRCLPYRELISLFWIDSMMKSHRGLGILKANASLIRLYMALSVGVISSFLRLVRTQVRHSWEIISSYKLMKLSVFILAKFLLV